MTEQPIKLFASLAERYPQPGEADAVHGAARAALASIPIVGDAAAEDLSVVLSPPVARRRDAWFIELANDLDRVEAKVDGFSVENLVRCEPFLSAVIQVSSAALATHLPDKRTLLRNALLNIALGKAPREELQGIFIAAIDAFSLSHVMVLDFLWRGLQELNRAGKWSPINPYGLSNYMTAISELHPELKGEESFLLYIMTELKNRGFSNVSRPDDSFPQQPGVTNMGIQFLQFILAPEM